ncbi:MAG: hypothetical protein GX379_00780 [Clostridiales bacterium]|nr:hypothetical protein [Clostridiales bacterium]
MDISRDNKGASLLELIIAMMIAAIILSMIFLFINSASKGFRKTNDNVNLQIEAQTIINQLSNLVMESSEMEIYEEIPEEKRYIFKYGMDEYYTVISRESLLYQVFTTDYEQAKTAPYTKEEHLLAEYVQSLDITKTSGNRAVDIDLRLSLGNDNERLTKKVKFRNTR